MQHMVIFRASDGKPSYHQTEDLDGAVKFVEHLRNDEQVADASIFRMQAVPIEVKTYYKVEVANTPPAPITIEPQAVATVLAPSAAAAVAAAPARPAAAPARPAASAPAAASADTAAPAPPAAEEPVPALAASTTAATPATITPPTPVANGRFGLFSRG